MMTNIWAVEDGLIEIKSNASDTGDKRDAGDCK